MPFTRGEGWFRLGWRYLQVGGRYASPFADLSLVVWRLYVALDVCLGSESVSEGPSVSLKVGTVWSRKAERLYEQRARSKNEDWHAHNAAKMAELQSQIDAIDERLGTA